MKKLLSAVVTLLYVTCFAQVDCVNEATHSGEGTYYTSKSEDIFGNCSFDESIIRPYYIGAMNEQDYAMADYCGACVEVDGPNGNVKVQIIDRCPECAPGDIDLSQEAFLELAPLVKGRIPISWKRVPCETTGPVSLYYKDGSHQWWTAVQVRNHRNQLAKLEFWNGTTYINLPRQQYNYFLKSDGMGVGPHTFRITDVYGNSIIEKNIPLIPEKEYAGINQFPKCMVTNLSEELAVVQSVQIGEDILLIGEGRYQLINTTGQVVQSGIANQKITTEKLNIGIYLLKVQLENKVAVHRILVR